MMLLVKEAREPSLLIKNMDEKLYTTKLGIEKNK
jgi:hypothetical protein